MVAERRQRIVIATPLNALWGTEGDVEADRIRNLDVDSITSMLRAGAVQFVVADVGSPLHWVPLAESSEFWATEAKDRLVVHHADDPRHERREGLCYTATLWRTDDAHDLVVLESHH